MADLAGLLRNIVPWFPGGDAPAPFDKGSGPPPEPQPVAQPSDMSVVDIYRQGVGLPTAAEEARNVAALRMSQAARPFLGGRDEGAATDVIQQLPGALISAPFRAAGQGADAMRRVAYGQLDPMSPEGIGEAFQAAMQVRGRSPFKK